MSATSHRRSQEQRRLQQEQLRVQQAEVERRQRQRRLLGIVAIALVALVVGGGVALQAWRTARAPSAVRAVPIIATSLTPVTVQSGKPIVLGNTSAPVKIQLYEDFHCSHCREFGEKFGPTLTAQQSSGVLAIEFYPMSFIDQGSTAAANAMACAAESGFGQSYYPGLFANAALDWRDSQLLDLAKKVSTSVPGVFNTCVTTKAHAAWVDSINATAAGNGVKQTPTMFVEGTSVDIAKLTTASLTSMIQAARK